MTLGQYSEIVNGHQFARFFEKSQVSPDSSRTREYADGTVARLSANGVLQLQKTDYTSENIGINLIAAIGLCATSVLLAEFLIRLRDAKSITDIKAERFRFNVWWPIAGIIFTPVAIYLVKSDLYYGHFIKSRTLYPIPMLLTLATDDMITKLTVFAALIQFPFYGTSIALFRNKLLGTLLICLAHLLAATLAFCGVLRAFS